MESVRRQRVPRPALRPRPAESGRRPSRRAGAAAGRLPRRHRHRGAGVGHLRPHAALHAQVRREARPRPHLRLALDRPRGPGRTAGRLAPEGLPNWSTPWRASTLRSVPGTRGGRLVAADRGLALLSRRDRNLSRSCEEAVERRPTGRRRPAGLAKRLRQQEQTASQEHGAHRRRPRLHGRPDRAGPPAGVGDRPARPAPQGVEALQARGPDARRQSRRLRRPPQGR